MDFSAPETPENRSQLQAVWHLMWSLEGVPYEMQTTEITILGNSTPSPPPLLRLPGGAEAFLRAVAGNFTLAEAVPAELFSGNELGPLLTFFGIDSQSIGGMVELLSELFGVRLSANPTHDELTRMFAKEDLAFRSTDGRTVIDIAEPEDKDGFTIGTHLADSLFEAEASGMIDTVYPLAKAFSDHDREDLLLRLFNVVHLHYPQNPDVFLQKNGQPSPSQAANLRSYEQLMRSIFEDGTLLDGLFELSTAVKRLEQRDVFVNEQLRLMLNHATRPDNFTTRAGDDFIILADGRTIQNLSRLHVLHRALVDLGERIDAAPEEREVFKEALGDALDVILEAQWPDGGDPEITDEGAIALFVSGATFLADKAELERDAGTLSAWLTEDLYTTLADFWSSRLLAGLVVVAEDILDDEGNQAILEDTTQYLVGTDRGRENTAMFAYQFVVRSVNTDAWVPIAKTLSRALDPDRPFDIEDARARLPVLSHGALVLNRTATLDPEGVGFALINRMVSRRGTRETPVSAIGSVIGRFWSADPSSDAPYDEADWRALMDNLIRYMRDDAHGLEQLYDLSELRTP